MEVSHSILLRSLKYFENMQQPKIKIKSIQTRENLKDKRSERQKYFSNGSKTGGLIRNRQWNAQRPERF